MTQFSAPAYNVERPTGRCVVTGRALEPGEPYVAALVDTDEPVRPDSGATAAGVGIGLHRVDVSLEAWQDGRRPKRVFSYWRSRYPEPNQKKRLFVDDEVLMNLFRRLGETDQPERAAFRFVLALVLMRKKQLRYEGSFVRPLPQPMVPTPLDEGTPEPPGPDRPVDQEVWRMTLKGDTEPMEVINPRLDEAQIGRVTQQLGEILEGEV